MGDYPYLMEPLGGRKRITINISKPNYPKGVAGKLVSIRTLCYKIMYTANSI